MQDFGCAGMLWGPAECVSYLSTMFTLEPGDVVALGTGAGVGWAKGMPPGPRTSADVLDHFYAGGGRYLRSGDIVVVEIPGLGRLENRVA
jgi:2-keto-4-pentenoate hydratase/2-oxohepta-3-ene-1,7-dioic acid hydratase in catechol pathway